MGHTHVNLLKFYEDVWIEKNIFLKVVKKIIKFNRLIIVAVVK